MSESSKVETSERDCSRADDFITDIHYYKLHIGCLRGPSEAGDGPPPRQDRLVTQVMTLHTTTDCAATARVTGHDVREMGRELAGGNPIQISVDFRQLRA